MHRPFGLSALFRVSLTIFFLLVGEASYAQIDEVKNQFVAGEVIAATGIVSVKNVVSGKVKDYLLNPDHSYLNLSINGTWYTNNMVGGQNYVGDLGGNPSQVKPTILDGWNTNIISDTIRSIWTNQDANGNAIFDIVQDVYPVAFRASGQIVIRVKIVNHTQSAISVEGLQWLNDLQAATSDNPWLLERNYYDAQRWRVPSKDGTNPTPPSFYVEFEHDPATLNLGTIGAGFTNDSFPPSPMGLTPCSGFAVVSWASTAIGFSGFDYLFGCPPPPSPPNATDLACVLQWTPKGVPAGATVEEFRTSFGTQEFCMCLGNAIAINVFPTHLQYSQQSRKYNPNPFNVLSMIFNVLGNAFTSATVTHSVTPGSSLKIVKGGTIASGGQSSAYHGATIPPGQMLNFYWSDSTAPNTNCNGAGTTVGMNFDMVASGYSGTWDCSHGVCDVLIDCADLDTVAPAHSKHVGVGPNGGSYTDTTFVVNDKRATDFGLKEIRWFKYGTDTSKIKVTVSPGLPTGCPKTDFTIEVQQLDSTKDGYVAFEFTDCAGNPPNLSRDTVWLTAHFPPNPPDIYPPKFYNRGYSHQNTPIHLGTDCTSTTNYQHSDWVVYDTFPQWHKPPFAHGLKSVAPVGSQDNMLFKADVSKAAPDSITFHIDVKDSMKDGDICIEAVDTVTIPRPNRDTICIHYCTVPDTTDPKIVYIQPTGAHSRYIHVADSVAWDRGIDSIIIFDGTNVKGFPSDVIVVGCKDTFGIDVSAINPNALSCFRIRVVDCSGNVDSSGVICMGQDTDVNCPKIVVTQNPGDVTHLHVTVIDATDQFEQGIDSVWFRGVKNMKLTYNGSTEAHCPGDPSMTFNAIHGTRSGKPRPSFQQSVAFDLEICDTNNIDVNQACVTIYAVDGAGHQACSTPYPYIWCVPLTVDTLAPLMRDSDVSCSSVSFIASDNRINDRGLSSFSFKNTVNIAPFDLNGLQGTDLSTKTMARSVIAKGKSAYGELAAMDAFGDKQTDPTVKAAHSASGKFWLYAQDLVMKASHVFLGEGNYDVKIVLDKNDSIKSLARKNIWEVKFDFHLDGDTSDIHFVTAKPGSFAPNWNVAVTPTGPNHYTLTATGAPLPDMTANEDVLLLLTFHANSAENTGATKIVLDPVACGNDSYAITYNGGADTGVAFINTTMTIHAPFGNMNGGILTIKGNCTPFASTDGAPPTAISMSPIQPNPAWKGTPSLHVMYTIADEGLVKINLYNSLGEKVRTVLSEDQKQGEYQIDVPSSDLPEGMYFLRLEAGGLMITRRVVLGGE